MAITWNPDIYFEKASKGSFAAKAARADVYKNNSEIFRAGAYETLSGKTIGLNPVPMLDGTVVYDAPIVVPDASPSVDAPLTGVLNTGCLELGRELQLKGYNPVILNLADAYVACGYYEKGSNAQEESLCRQSTLSQSLYQYYGERQSEKSGVAFQGKKYPMDHLERRNGPGTHSLADIVYKVCGLKTHLVQNRELSSVRSCEQARFLRKYNTKNKTG